MLDVQAIAADVSSLADQVVRRAKIRGRQIDRALIQATIPDDQWRAEHAERVEKSETRRLTGVPISNSSVAAACAAPSAPAPFTYSALAVDGSHLPPSRHEAAQCGLINIGRIAIHYGTGERPMMASTAKLELQQNEIGAESLGDDDNSSAEDHTRMLTAEIEALTEMIGQYGGRANPIAFIDGTLILWMLEDDENRSEALASFLALLDAAEASRTPIVGYISSPTSREVVAALRISLCPEQVVKCKACPHTGIPELPCAPIEHVRDEDLFANLLRPGMRSGVFLSRSHILRFYKRESRKIAFFYLNTGREIARIEIPRWVADDLELLNRCHAVALDQVDKGAGYPVCLMEAHERAVISSADRAAFLRIVERALQSRGMPAVRTAKALSKRRPMA